jgi:hypothetical protein
MLFLSYAEEDGASARRIAQWLKARQQTVYEWEDPQRRGGQFLADMEKNIIEADAFLALMSPNFTKSPYCHREAQLAILCEEDLRTRQRDARFVRVLMVERTDNLSAGLLATYDWLDVSDEQKTDQALPGMVGSLPPGESPRAAQPYIASPPFRNREDETERVLHGLTNASGPHFWLVLGPPQLGKTWFMDHVAAKLRSEAAKLRAEPVEWAARRIDIRDYPDEQQRSDVALLLTDLFRLDSSPRTGAEGKIDEGSLLSITKTVLERRKPHLCLLDSAELLENDTVRELRRCLCEIYSLVQSADVTDVRLALIVASRRQDEWRGVTPAPRLAALSLTQFTPHVIRGTLQDLAGKMGRPSPRDMLDRDAARVYRLSVGLPALVALCIRWIQKEQWLRMERLESQQLFEEMVKNYIRKELLSHDSILPRDREDDDDDDQLRYVLEYAFRSLTAYRRFTQSHLRHHMVSDPAFAGALVNPAWKGLLWRYLAKSTLLVQPQYEPWQQMQPAIRRLLFRYFNKTDRQREDAHAQALNFADIWKTGNEPVIHLLECLWHEAAILRLSGDSDMEEKLCNSAREYARSLPTNPLIEDTDLREFAATMIRNDEEFGETVDNIDGLIMKLAQIVESTEEP